MIFKIGKHRVRCGSVMDDLSELTDGQQFDIIYTDPPWGQGNINYWQTINMRHTGASRKPIQYVEMINRLFDLYKAHSKNLLLIEYGQRWRGDIQKLGNEHGFKSMGIVKRFYGSGSKLYQLDMHIFAKTPVTIPNEYEKSFGKKFGYESVEIALTPFTKPGMTMFDPMCGLGLGAKYAVKHGLTFYGNELNQKRLNQTIKTLQSDGRK